MSFVCCVHDLLLFGLARTCKRTNQIPFAFCSPVCSMLAARGPTLQRLSVRFVFDDMDDDHPSLLPATLEHCPQLAQLTAKDLWPHDATTVHSAPMSLVVTSSSCCHCQGQTFQDIEVKSVQRLLQTLMLNGKCDQAAGQDACTADMLQPAVAALPRTGVLLATRNASQSEAGL